MDPWARAVSLFHEIAAFDAAVAVRRQRCELASQGLADWYLRTEGLLLEALSVELERRVAQLGGIGRSIRLTSPSTPSVFAQGGASLRFLSVCFDDEVVTAYSLRHPGTSLMLHWAWQLRTPGDRFPRILSVPGICVRRGSEQELVLEAVGARALATPARLGLSDIAGEILAMLAEAALNRRRLAGGRPGTRTHVPRP